MSDFTLEGRLNVPYGEGDCLIVGEHEAGCLETLLNPWRGERVRLTMTIEKLDD